MNYFKGKIEAYWQESAVQRESMARDAMHLYEKRIDLRSAKVLEIGCGTGDFSLELSKAGASVVALDLSHERIAAIKKRADAQGLEMDVLVGDAQRTSFDDETFDLILCRNVIEHVSDPRKLVEEMARILKPGGAIQLTAPNRLSFMQIFRDEHYRLPLVVILPRKVAAFIVCRIFDLEDEYSVSIIPSYALLKGSIKSNGLISKMDLPDGELIRGKWTDPGKVNNRLIKFVVRAAKALRLNRIIANIACSEHFLGLFPPRWSLWITKPAGNVLP